MIITRDVEVTVDSTFEGEKVKMGFDEDAMSHIMAILSEQYSDPSMAVVREYTTNAIDAQVEYGWHRPVEITTPSWTEAIFSVQDYGVGMNADIIRDVYANYGSSTKRNSNNFNGTLGIGSKSAFAYTNQFTVESNRNGVKTIVVVSRDEDGGGDMTIVSAEPTDDHSGTKISVPVSNMTDFIRNINLFAERLAPGLLLVDGEDKSAWGGYTKILGAIKDANGEIIINGIYHTNKRDYYYGRNDRVYMGGVSYPALEDISDVRTEPAYNIMVDVALGRVQFSPSRESLKDVKSTRAVLELAGKMYKQHLATQVKADINKAKSIFEAIKIYRQNNVLLSDNDRDSISYNSITLSQSTNMVRLVFNSASRTYDTYITWTAFDGDGSATSGRTITRSSNIDISSLHEAQPLFIRGFQLKSLSHAHKKKIQYYIENVFDAPDYFTLADGKARTAYIFDKVPSEVSGHDILGKVDWVEWSDIASIKLPTASRTSSSRGSMGGKRSVMAKGEYDYWLQDVAETKSKNIFYNIGGVIKKQMTADGYSTSRGGVDSAYAKDTHTFLSYQADDAIMVNVYANSEKKFLSEFPNATKIEHYSELRKPIFDAFLKEFKDNIDSIAMDSAISNSAVCQRARELVLYFGRALIDDPALHFLDTTIDTNVSLYNLSGSEKHRQEASTLLAAAKTDVATKIAAVESCYPMLSVVELGGRWNLSQYQSNCELVRDYLNTTYNKEN